MTESNPGGSLVPESADAGRLLARYRRQGSHWKRYEFSRAFCRGRSVLDLGCGYGYGAAILGPVPKEYVGVDLDRSAIAWARANMAPRVPNARFLELASFNAESPSATFGAVLAFEVLEHVDDPERFLLRASDRLARDGILILSTPNGAVSSGKPGRFRSPLHRRELTASELQRLLAPIRGTVAFWKEHRWDRLDAVGLRWGLAEARVARSRGLRGWAGAFARRMFDGPVYWRISRTDLAQMDEPNFATIVTSVERSGPVPPRS